MADKLDGTTLRPFVQVKGELRTYNDGEKRNSTNAELGLRLNGNDGINNYPDMTIEGAVKLGTDIGIRAKLGGTTMPINEKVGSYLNLGGDYSHRLDSREFTYQIWGDFGLKYAPNENFNVAFGAKAGLQGRGEFIPRSEISCSIIENDEVKDIVPTKDFNPAYIDSTTDPVLLPIVSAEYNFNSHMSINAEATPKDAQVGFRWTF